MAVTFRTLRTQRNSYWDASESLTVSPSLVSEWFRCSAMAAATRKDSSTAFVEERSNWFGRRVAAGAVGSAPLRAGPTRRRASSSS